MFSKYYNYTTNELLKADASSVSALSFKMGKELPIKKIQQINPGGTFGLFFKGIFQGKEVFLKTHHPNEMASQNIRKEIYIMNKLYSDILGIGSFSINMGGMRYQILLMDYISIKALSYDIKYIQKLINSYRRKLYEIDMEILNYSIEDFYYVARISVDQLMKEALIDKEIYKFCNEALKNFQYYSEYDREVCHGDLSNMNIVGIDGQHVALDWEDAMVCVPNYDLLYWLTFFSQRKYYSSYLLRDLGIKERYGKDVMVMILLIKSYMSYLNGSYLKNKLSIQDRLKEIIKM